MNDCALKSVCLLIVSEVIMELMDGDMRSLLRGCGPKGDSGEARGWLAQIMMGIQSLHDNQVMHRDLKPENILVRRSWHGTQMKIGDLGMAKEVTTKRPHSPTVSTEYYRAPEILRHPGEYNLVRVSSFDSIVV